MKSCPPELHSYICSLACTDDGYTARSLSLVSKYFAQITAPYLYQSLCVSDPSKIRNLARKLQQLPAHHRRIHHLFLSDTSGERDLTNAIVSILTFAASTLETLAFVTTSPFNSTPLIARLFRMRFPRVYELTISGHYPFPSSSSCFPSLERLHLLGNRNPHGLLSLGGLESSLPTLTHLRISGLNLAVSFSQELHQAFEFTSRTRGEEEGGESVTAAAATGCMFPSKLPPNLEQFIVQCGPEPAPCRPGSSSSTIARQKDQTMINTLEHLQALLVKEGGYRTQFSVFPRGRTEISLDDIRTYWVARLRGKEGCWSCT